MLKQLYQRLAHQFRPLSGIRGMAAANGVEKVAGEKRPLDAGDSSDISDTAKVPRTEVAGEKRPLDAEDSSDISDTAKVPRTEGRLDRKRAVALMFGYNGKGYHGLQLNKGFPTIESELIDVLLEMGTIPQEHYNTVQQMSFQRAARTDKGVSAIGNVVSLKMLINIDNLREKINEKLPQCIRLFDIKRTTKGFNCKNMCDGRTYIYLCPTFAFAPEGQEAGEEYRILDEEIASINSILKRFVGSHNFHNYTSTIKPWEKKAMRYIISFECCEPCIRDGVEFVTLRVRGQSFVMHHIRKMIGITIAIQRGMCGVDVIDKSWLHDKVDIPKAPGLGLVLEKLHYNNYNRRFCSGDNHNGGHDPLEWDHLAKEMEQFRDERIFSDIVKTEKEEKSMVEWLQSLYNHNFESTPTPWKKEDRHRKPIARSSSPSKRRPPAEQNDSPKTEDKADTETLNSNVDNKESSVSDSLTITQGHSDSTANQIVASESTANETETSESTTNQTETSESTAKQTEASESTTNQTEASDSLAHPAGLDSQKPIETENMDDNSVKTDIVIEEETKS